MKKTIEAPTMNILAKNRSEVRTILRTIDDVQAMRIRTGNRLKKKADGTDQKDAEERMPDITNSSILENVDLLDGFKTQEDSLTKILENAVKQTPEWKGYFKDIKGIGPKMAAIIISEIDPVKGATVSKMWQYAGLNPGMVRGKKKNASGEVILTDEMIRGDRKTKGFLCPYNSYLKTGLCGKIVTQLMMAKNPRYYGIYLNARNFYETNPEWKSESKSHADMAAKRKVAKMFLQDYYAFVRPLYGLETRVPYAEEKMGIVHHNYSN